MNNIVNWSTKKITFGLFVFSLVGVLVAYLILHSNLNASATGDMLVRTGKSLFYGMSALALIFFILIFTQQTFSAWKKFAVWFIPLATLLFIFYPDPSSGDYFSPYPEQIFKWVSVLYVVISILIITLKTIKQKSEKID